MKNDRITEHVLVPQHEILGEEEAKRVMEEYKITKENLPKILITDPMIKILKAKIGDVIRITRKSPTSGKYYYYRIVSQPME